MSDLKKKALPLEEVKLRIAMALDAGAFRALNSTYGFVEEMAGKRRRRQYAFEDAECIVQMVMDALESERAAPGQASVQ